ncbi:MULTISPECIES: trans-aconitate 2-methyltransferase [Frankia]|nr:MULTISPECIES: class I SAM-dependent methyltransferase [Frankia]
MLWQEISESKASSVMDLGCGSGYLTRRLLARSSGQIVRWVLVDSNRDALAFARERLNGASNIEVAHGDITQPQPSRWVDPVDFAFLAFTLLEVQVDATVASNIEAQLAPSGTVVVVLPDVLTDIYQLGDPAVEALGKYIKGQVFLDKIDKFTGRSYPFYAQRIEKIISAFLDCSFFLSNIRQIETRTGHSIYFLRFRRRS